MTKMLYVTDLDGTLVRSVFEKKPLEVNTRLLNTLTHLKSVAFVALVTSASRKTCHAILSELV